MNIRQHLGTLDNDDDDDDDVKPPYPSADDYVGTDYHHHHHHEDDEGNLVDEDEVLVAATASASKSPKRTRKKRDITAMRKAPQAPKRFKSSYICFFTSKQSEIKEELGKDATVEQVSKRSAEMWKNITSEERAYWDDLASKDKERYMLEKAAYTGPWQIPYKRAKKDPSAPKV
jgi:hypothetical protein